MNREAIHRALLDWRGVEDPCKACAGAGVRSYGSTSTWRGGIGGQMITQDVCDTCWGTGDEHRHGANLRAVLAERRAMTERECAEWLARRVGADFARMREHLTLLAAVVEAESRRRKGPAGVDLFWYSRSAEGVAQVLRELAQQGGGE